MGIPHRNSTVVGRSNWRDSPRSRFIHGQADRYSFFRGGGLGGRPRTPKDSPLWGRPSGARPGKRRSGSGRQAQQREGDRRFEEIDSDGGDDQGVGLNRTLAGDELRFTGEDLGRRRKGYEYLNRSESSEDYGDSDDGENMQLALRDKEELLVQKALERIRRAQMLGKTNVKLTQPELDALERKRRKDQAIKDQAKRKGSGTNLRTSDRRRSSGQTNSAFKDPKIGKRESKGYFSGYDGESSSSSRRATPPGVLVPGQGVVGFSPLGQYSPTTAPQVRSSRSDSRSASSQSLAQPSPPLRSSKKRYSSGREPPQPLPAPPSTHSVRRLPDDPNWLPRPRSSSSVSAQAYDPYQYQSYSPPIPQIPPQYSQGRRIVSSPQPEVHNPRIRGEPEVRLTEPSSFRREHTGQATPDDFDSDGSSLSHDDDDDGVHVDVVPYGQGYSVDMRPESSARESPRRGGR